MSLHPFTMGLYNWFEENARDLPWKKTKDPYTIWISEIILQQTRVGQGMPYYFRFIERFPDVATLAKASQDEVLKYWEGLGYYSRARNLHASAKKILETYNGIFPKEYKDILSLKGIGPYTAAAIASFAYNLPYAAVDGNVIRVISRYFGIEEEVDKSSILKEIRALAQMVLDNAEPGVFNQAMMDFGSLHCTSDNPMCLFCPLADSCLAYSKNLQNVIPIKGKKIKKRKRYFHFLMFQSKDTILIKRRDSGIWKGLYDFPMIENESTEILENELKNYKVNNVSSVTKHILTHQLLHIRFYHISKPTKMVGFDNCIEVKTKDLTKYAFPKPINQYLSEILEEN